MNLFTLEHGPLAYRFDFLLYGVAVLGMVAALLRFAPVSQRLTLVAVVALGLLSCSLIEYLVHRFVLHALPPFSRWHQEHHHRPRALICSPTFFSTGLIVGLVFLPAWWLQGVWVAMALTLGMSVGYLSYATVHHATHHWRAGPGWLRTRKRWHALHHQSASARFGVTTSLWDHLLGSATEPKSRPP
jgi:sterol desaturase/sphingolipid hydroxylase (fatty acid hydroxylase superfamily)